MLMLIMSGETIFITLFFPCTIITFHERGASPLEKLGPLRHQTRQWYMLYKVEDQTGSPIYWRAQFGLFEYAYLN